MSEPEPRLIVFGDSQFEGMNTLGSAHPNTEGAAAVAALLVEHMVAYGGIDCRPWYRRWWARIQQDVWIAAWTNAAEERIALALLRRPLRRVDKPTTQHEPSPR